MIRKNDILRRYVQIILHEGGLKSSKTAGVKLDPAAVKKTVEIYEDIFRQWNDYLESKGFLPVELVGPTGSTYYYQKDAIENPEISYGDTDYLVTLSATEAEKSAVQSESDRKKFNRDLLKKYESLLVKFLREKRPILVDVEETTRSVPWMLILKVPEVGHVQVDTVITFPDNVDWMRGRYTPERGKKGYTIGLIYTTLGNLLTLEAGTSGVISKTKDGKRVSRIGKGVESNLVSRDPRNFLMHIAHYLGEDDVKIDKSLIDHPGVDPNNIKISDLAAGIKGLIKTLYPTNYRELLKDFIDDYATRLEATIQKKLARGMPEEKVPMLRDLNSEVISIVSSIFM